MLEESSYDKDLKLLEQRRSLVVKKVQLVSSIVLSILILHCMRVLTLQDLWVGIIKIPELLTNSILSLGRLLGNSIFN